MQNVLQTAIEQHRSGQLGLAAQLYQSVVSREPENAEALHLLGVLFHQQGDPSRAVEHIGRALALRPNANIYHANLAEAYRAWAISNGPPGVVAQPWRSGRITPKRSVTWRGPGRAGTACGVRRTASPRS